MKVGFIGLGAMGKPMAWNIEETEHELGVYNRTESKMEEFAEKGVETYSSSMELARNSEVVILMVTNGDAVINVLADENGVLEGLSGDEIVINMSTNSPEATEEADELVQSTGARFIDSPVSGTVGPAREGTLTILASGTNDDIEDVEDILEAMGEPVVNCGEIGQGTNMKLMINLLLGDMMQAFSEALSFGKSKNLELEKMQKVINSSACDSTVFRAKGEQIKERDFESRFALNLLSKDVNLATEAAGEEDVPMPVTSATREALNAAQAQGHGEEDMAALVKYIEEVTDRKLE